MSKVQQTLENAFWLKYMNNSEKTILRFSRICIDKGEELIFFYAIKKNVTSCK